MLLRLSRLLSLMAVLAALWGIGLIIFVETSLGLEPASAPAADTIIVLTGGRDRLREGFSLLAQKRGDTLLITGVNPQVTQEALLQEQEVDLEALQLPKEKLVCCVTLDYRAQDTVDNANETAKWVTANRYRSLWLVTSNYHMLRALQEFRRAMPEVEIFPYPVVPQHVSSEAWWRSAGVRNLYLVEYHKYLGAVLRGFFAANSGKRG